MPAVLLGALLKFDSAPCLDDIFYSQFCNSTLKRQRTVLKMKNSKATPSTMIQTLIQALIQTLI